jgi:HlyD family secretion protein
MTLTWKRGVGLGVAAVIVAALVLALRPAPIAVETARVNRGPLRETIDEEGWTRVQDRYVVAAPVAGRVARLTLREGDTVGQGQIVAQLYPAPLDPRSREEGVARVSQAEDAERAAKAAVAQARAAYDQARRTSARARELASRGLGAAEDRERAELDETTRQRELESADFRAQAAAHDAEVARAAISSDRALGVVLRSPVRGRVLRITEPSERVVLAGAALLEVGDPSRLEVVADLLSSDAVRVHVGDPLLIEGWGGDAPLHGRLRVVEPSGFTKVSALGVEEQRVNVIGDFTEPAGPLGDRYRVDVSVVVWETPGALQAPASALFRHGEGWSVFVLEAGRARQQNVVIGHRTSLVVEIVRGLNAGDLVIRNPTDRVTAGVRVR